MRESFQNLDQMRQWLKQSVGIAVIAIGIQGSFSDLYTNMTSPIAVASAIQSAQQHTSCDTSRPCFVDYEAADEPDPFPELDYDQFIVSFIAEAKMPQNGRLIGGADNLIKAISGHEVLVCMDPPGSAARVGHVLIRMPTNPLELSQLKSSLEEHSFISFIPDGSGEMHFGNRIDGRGFKPS